MSAEPYSDAVRRGFAEPRHAGSLDGATRVLREDQGVRIELSAIVADDRLMALGFRAWACPHVIAAAETVCAAFEGREPAALEQFRGAQIMQTLAIPAEKTGRILVLEDTVRALGQAISGSAR